ncbi:MAG: ABC transporter ATP-binding protein, partial [Pseudomonadota bacterium]
LRNTMIYVTHDQIEAMTLATRLAVMRDGRIQQLGTPDEVYTTPANLFVAGFLGAPSMNFLKGKIESSEQSLVFVADQLQLNLSGYNFKTKPANGHATVLGIRPEHIQIASDGAMSGTVSLIEPMGNHHVVWVDHNGTLLSAIMHESFEFDVDDVIKFTIDLSKISLFDQAGEERL